MRLEEVLSEGIGAHNKETDMVNYEVINIKTGKSVAVYDNERFARLRYNDPAYKIVKTDKPANAFPVGVSVF